MYLQFIHNSRILRARSLASTILYLQPSTYLGIASRSSIVTNGIETVTRLVFLHCNFCVFSMVVSKCFSCCCFCCMKFGWFSRSISSSCETCAGGAGILLCWGRWSGSDLHSFSRYCSCLTAREWKSLYFVKSCMHQYSTVTFRLGTRTEDTQSHAMNDLALRKRMLFRLQEIFYLLKVLFKIVQLLCDSTNFWSWCENRITTPILHLTTPRCMDVLAIIPDWAFHEIVRTVCAISTPGHQVLHILGVIWKRVHKHTKGLNYFGASVDIHLGLVLRKIRWWGTVRCLKFYFFNKYFKP